MPIQVRVPWVGEVKECKFEKNKIFAIVERWSSKLNLDWNALREENTLSYWNCLGKNPILPNGLLQVQLTDQTHICNSRPKKYHPRGFLKPMLRLIGPGRNPRGPPWALPLRDR